MTFLNFDVLFLYYILAGLIHNILVYLHMLAKYKQVVTIQHKTKFVVQQYLNCTHGSIPNTEWYKVRSQ